MPYKKFRFMVFDKETGEIFLDEKTRGCLDENVSKVITAWTNMYLQQLKKHPFARFSIIPLGDSNQQQNLFTKNLF